jgi:hypothetical protein
MPRPLQHLNSLTDSPPSSLRQFSQQQLAPLSIVNDPQCYLLHLFGGQRVYPIWQSAYLPDDILHPHQMFFELVVQQLIDEPFAGQFGGIVDPR